MNYDAIVVGGGAAGLIAAGFVAKEGAKVLVAEKMSRPARKILVTGKGRCNVTNNCDMDTFMNNVKTNPRFLYSSYSGFTAQDTMALFESLGVPVETQRGNRVFPQSERAKDIADAMVRFATGHGAVIQKIEVDGLLLEGDRVTGVSTAEGEKISATRVIVATGGKSYPLTGSTGDGYQFARQVGHTIKEIRPSLIPIVTKEKWVADAMGLSLKNVTLKLLQAGKKKPIYQELGEMIFTHFGVSGPLVLSASAYMSKPATEYLLEIDMKPALSHQQLDARLLRDINERSNQNLSNILGGVLPKGLIPIIIKLLEADGELKGHQITGELRERVAKLIKAIPLTPSALRPLEEAVITAGGVAVKEIDPKTMESKLINGLYFAGEVLDLDAYTGGFNLQIAFSTGHTAGTTVGRLTKGEK